MKELIKTCTSIINENRAKWPLEPVDKAPKDYIVVKGNQYVSFYDGPFKTATYSNKPEDAKRYSMARAKIIAKEINGDILKW